MEQAYKVLDEISHIRLRTGMYAGSVSPQTSLEYVYDLSAGKMSKKEVTYVPALIKIFSEILDNAIDEGKRHPETLSEINVEFNNGQITIEDNGKGIPVEIHPQTGSYIATTVFSNLRAGSNFNDEDDQALIGTNGVGSTLTNVLSKRFEIQSCDGSKVLSQVFSNGMTEIGEPRIGKSKKNGTKISFIPDYEFFKLEGLTNDIHSKMVKKVIDAAACNSNIKFTINAEKVNIKSFSDYVKMYSDDYVVDEQEDWKVGVCASDGFEQISFINSVETYQGGTHVDYVSLQIINAIREFVRKKHKIDVKPADIKNQLCVFISGTVNRPKFSSQTKENMISPVSEYKTSWSAPDKFIKKILQSTIIQSILDWAEAKAKLAELAELRKLNKDSQKQNLKGIKKFNDATNKDRSGTCLFLAEGDSAAGPIKGSRNPKVHGVFALKGRPINVSAAEPAKIRANAEAEALRTILGLKHGVPADTENLYFEKIVLASDADQFGHSIAGLGINLFYRQWPELVKSGKIYRLVTPIWLVTHKKNTLEFFSDEEFENWRNANSKEKYTYKFLKGLGSSPDFMWKKYMANLDNYLIQFEFDKDAGESLDLAFLKEAGSTDKRKVWLDLE
jgi:DNA topoisomerase-2